MAADAANFVDTRSPEEVARIHAMLAEVARNIANVPRVEVELPPCEAYDEELDQ